MRWFEKRRSGASSDAERRPCKQVVLTLGSGKRLFAGGTIPAAFRVTEGEVTPSGVIVVNYERAFEPQRREARQEIL